MLSMLSWEPVGYDRALVPPCAFCQVTGMLSCVQDPSDPIAVEAGNCIQVLVRTACSHFVVRSCYVGLSRWCDMLQGQDAEQGPTVNNICAKLSTEQFMQQSLCERRLQALLQFISSDHEDSVSGRVWNSDFRAALLTFLGSEIEELERFNTVGLFMVCDFVAVVSWCRLLQSVGSDTWDGSVDKWNTEHLSLLSG